MARLARLVIPGMPHDVIQRGNRRQRTFFNDGDYAAYLELMSEWCREEGVDIWGYCLMPNHTHLIAVPGSEQGLRRAVGEAHRRYTRRVNSREKWRGYLWQGLLNSALREEELKALRAHGRTGRPLGDEPFLERLEGLVGRVLKPQKGGRPRKQRNQSCSNSRRRRIAGKMGGEWAVFS